MKVNHKLIWESVHPITLQFKNEDLRIEYENNIALFKAKQLSLVYALMSLVCLIWIAQASLTLQSNSNPFILKGMGIIACAFLVEGILIKLCLPLFRLWNILGIFTLNIAITSLIHENQEIYEKMYLSLSVVSVLMSVALMRFNSNFIINFIATTTTLISQYMVIQELYIIFLVASYIILIYGHYKSEFFSKSAFWLEKISATQNNILESAVNLSLLFVRYNSKNQRLELSRGNNRFNSKFEVTDDESMKEFLQKTKIIQDLAKINSSKQNICTINNSFDKDDDKQSKIKGIKSQLFKDNEIIRSPKHPISWQNLPHQQKNSISYTNSKSFGWNESLEALIYDLIEKNHQRLKQKRKLLKESSIQIFFSKTFEILKKLLLIKKQTKRQSSIVIKQKCGNEFRDKDGNTSPTIKTQQAQSANDNSNMNFIRQFTNKTSLQDIQFVSNFPSNTSKQIQFMANKDPTNSINNPSSDFPFNQNKISLMSPSRTRNQNLKEPLSSTSKKYDKKIQLNQIELCQSKDPLFFGTKNGIFSSQQKQLKAQEDIKSYAENFLEYESKDQNIQSYQARFMNSAGKLIKFIVRIIIYEMNDTFVAVSIEKEDQLEKYKQSKGELFFMRSAFSQFVEETKIIIQNQLSSLRLNQPVNTQISELIQKSKKNYLQMKSPQNLLKVNPSQFDKVPDSSFFRRNITVPNSQLESMRILSPPNNLQCEQHPQKQMISDPQQVSQYHESKQFKLIPTKSSIDSIISLNFKGTNPLQPKENGFKESGSRNVDSFLQVPQKEGPNWGWQQNLSNSQFTISDQEEKQISKQGDREINLSKDFNDTFYLEVNKSKMIDKRQRANTALDSEQPCNYQNLSLNDLKKGKDSIKNRSQFLPGEHQIDKRQGMYNSQSQKEKLELVPINETGDNKFKYNNYQSNQSIDEINSNLNQNYLEINIPKISSKSSNSTERSSYSKIQKDKEKEEKIKLNEKREDQEYDQSLHENFILSKIVKSERNDHQDYLDSLEKKFKEFSNKLLFQTYKSWYSAMNYEFMLCALSEKKNELLPTEVNTIRIMEGLSSMFQQEGKQRDIHIQLQFFNVKELKIITYEYFLRQILFNLLQNSLENSPRQSAISLNVDKDSKFQNCLKFTILNFVKTKNNYKISESHNFENLQEFQENDNLNQLPGEEECLLQIDQMSKRAASKGKLNLGLRVAQQMVKKIGPIDKIIFSKGELKNQLIAEFSIFCDINLLSSEVEKQNQSTPFYLESTKIRQKVTSLANNIQFQGLLNSPYNFKNRSFKNIKNDSLHKNINQKIQSEIEKNASLFETEKKVINFINKSNLNYFSQINTITSQNILSAQDDQEFYLKPNDDERRENSITKLEYFV